MSADNLPKRPVSVFLLQVLVAVLFAISLGSLARGVFIATRPDMHLIVPAFARAILVHMGFLAFLGLTFWALAKRKAYGRWLGLVCIVALPAAGIYRHLHDDGMPQPFLFRSSNNAQRLGEIFGEGLSYLLMVWWFFSFGFSRRAKAFFSGS